MHKYLISMCVVFFRTFLTFILSPLWYRDIITNLFSYKKGVNLLLKIKCMMMVEKNLSVFLKNFHLFSGHTSVSWVALDVNTHSLYADKMLQSEWMLLRLSIQDFKIFTSKGVFFLEKTINWEMRASKNGQKLKVFLVSASFWHGP